MAENLRPQRLTVQLGQRSYGIELGVGGLDSVGDVARSASNDGRALIVTDRNVADLYGATCHAAMTQAGFETALVAVPPGERTKSYHWLRALHNAMVESHLSRKSLVVALGGGVVGDLAGFAAATYMRGIGVIQAPTSLLAMVDSSVGGKTAINHPAGKNLIGAFLQPQCVVCDVSVLSSLSPRDVRSGLAEVVKHGIIADAAYLSMVEDRLGAILSREPSDLMAVVAGSCRIKSAVVAADEQEFGLRRILNYGHTFGHAFEKVGGYRRCRHGEAVALGMVCAGQLSVELGLLAPEDAGRIEELLVRIGLPTKFAGGSVAELESAMSLDKKATSGALKLVVCEGIGRVRVIDDPGRGLVRAALKSVLV